MARPRTFTAALAMALLLGRTPIHSQEPAPAASTPDPPPAPAASTAPTAPTPTPTATGTAAEGSEPNETVDALKAKHLKNLAQAEKQLLAEQLAALQQLEKSRADKGDYAGAARVQARIQELEREVGPPNGTKYLILSSALDHQTQYGVSKTNDGKLALRKTGGVVKWANVTLPSGPGWYQVTLHYENPEKYRPVSARMFDPSELEYGGEISFQEETSLKQAGVLKSPVVYPDEDTAEQHTLFMGKLNLDSARTTFILKTEVAKSGGLMVFKDVTLSPTTAPTATNELADLVRSYREAMKPKTAPVHDVWLAKLREFEKTFTETGHAEGLSLVQAEIHRVQPYSTANTSKLVTDGIAKALPVVIKMSEGIKYTTNGEMRLNPSTGLLQRLRPASARLSINLATAKVLPGRYDIALSLQRGSGCGGLATLACGESKRRLEIPVGYEVSEPIQAPGFWIGPGERFLELTVTELRDKNGSLGDLAEVRLVPSEDQRPPERKTSSANSSASPANSEPAKPGAENP